MPNFQSVFQGKSEIMEFIRTDVARLEDHFLCELAWATVGCWLTGEQNSFVSFGE